MKQMGIYTIKCLSNEKIYVDLLRFTGQKLTHVRPQLTYFLHTTPTANGIDYLLLLRRNGVVKNCQQFSVRGTLRGRGADTLSQT